MVTFALSHLRSIFLLLKVDFHYYPSLKLGVNLHFSHTVTYFKLLSVFQFYIDDYKHVNSYLRSTEGIIFVNNHDIDVITQYFYTFLLELLNLMYRE